MTYKVWSGTLSLYKLTVNTASKLFVCQDLASRARAGKLTLDEFQGGTFT